jgi:bifunctional non-homologous end joining protein LigD
MTKDARRAGEREKQMGLETYRKMRDFERTPEPKGTISKTNRHRFVMQEHHASKLHFDFRLEMDGVLKSWSVPRGPSLDSRERRLAVPTEDHPVEYLKFEGHIPEGNYGAGEHMIWDEGTYKLLEGDDPLKQVEAGNIKFELRGEKLRGAFNLLKMKGRGDAWLLIKSRDEFAVPGWELKLRQPTTDGDSIAGVRRQPATSERRRVAHEGVKRFSTKPQAGGERIVPVGRALAAKELSGDINVRVGDAVVPLTHLDKIYWPDEGYTKGDLVRYYDEIAKFILPYLKDRPLIMKRYPGGISGKFFHQHDVNEAPDFVRTIELDVEEGQHAVDYVVGDTRATLLYMANLGAIERHPWHSRVEDLDHPDWIVFDLDPGEGIEYPTICELALRVRDVLVRLGLESYPKTSGSRGLHVYVPIRAVYSYEQVAEFAEAAATLVARENAAVATVERALKKRKKGQIYVDHMQNARGKSVVAPYSVRPKAGAPVSMPLKWKEVEGRKITPRDFTIRNAGARLAREGDLFRPVLKQKQRLDEALHEVKKLLKSAKAGRDKM